MILIQIRSKYTFTETPFLIYISSLTKERGMQNISFRFSFSLFSEENCVHAMFTLEVNNSRGRGRLQVGCKLSNLSILDRSFIQSNGGVAGVVLGPITNEQTPGALNIRQG